MICSVIGSIALAVTNCKGQRVMSSIRLKKDGMRGPEEIDIHIPVWERVKQTSLFCTYASIVNIVHLFVHRSDQHWDWKEVRMNHLEIQHHFSRPIFAHKRIIS